MIKLKNILAENMRRFGTKNLNENDMDPSYLKYAKKKTYKLLYLILKPISGWGSTTTHLSFYFA